MRPTTRATTLPPSFTLSAPPIGPPASEDADRQDAPLADRVGGAASPSDQAPPSPDDLKARLETIKCDYFCGQGGADRDGLFVARLLSLVPQIETQEQMDLHVCTLDDFQGLPGIDGYEASLTRQARKQGLHEPDLARIDAHYPLPFSLETLVGGDGGRWTLSASGAIQMLPAPYRDWLTTEAGQDRPTYVPPGLQEAVAQLLPTLQDANAEQLRDFLQAWTWLPADNGLRQTLLAAVLGHSLSDSAPRLKALERQVEQTIERLTRSPEHPALILALLTLMRGLSPAARRSVCEAVQKAFGPPPPTPSTAGPSGPSPAHDFLQSVQAAQTTFEHSPMGMNSGKRHVLALTVALKSARTAADVDALKTAMAWLLQKVKTGGRTRKKKALLAQMTLGLCQRIDYPQGQRGIPHDASLEDLGYELALARLKTLLG